MKYTNILRRDFYERKPQVVAKELLGKLLVVQDGKKTMVGKIVETEAYLGEGDRASHSHRGETARNKIMFGPAGHAYVYFTYGMHWLLNFITEKEGKPSGVLIRAVEPVYDSNRILKDFSIKELKQLGAGPARLTKWLSVTGVLNGSDITVGKNIFVTDSFEVSGQVFKSFQLSEKEIKKAPRIGVGFAGPDAELLLRFYILDNPFISKVG